MRQSKDLLKPLKVDAVNVDLNLDGLYVGRKVIDNTNKLWTYFEDDNNNPIFISDDLVTVSSENADLSLFKVREWHINSYPNLAYKYIEGKGFVKVVNSKPDISFDEQNGFSVNQYVIYQDTVFKCLDNTNGAAKWQVVSPLVAPYSQDNSDKYLKVSQDGTLEWAEVASGGTSDVQKFTDLEDTPVDYQGNAGKLTFVKQDETGLEFDVLDNKVSFIALKDTPSDYQGNAGKIPVVNETENGLEFGQIDECNQVNIIKTYNSYPTQMLTIEDIQTMINQKIDAIPQDVRPNIKYICVGPLGLYPINQGLLENLNRVVSSITCHAYDDDICFTSKGTKYNMATDEETQLYTDELDANGNPIKLVDICSCTANGKRVNAKKDGDTNWALYDEQPDGKWHRVAGSNYGCLNACGSKVMRADKPNKILIDEYNSLNADGYSTRTITVPCTDMNGNYDSFVIETDLNFTHVIWCRVARYSGFTMGIVELDSDLNVINCQKIAERGGEQYPWVDVGISVNGDLGFIRWGTDVNKSLDQGIIFKDDNGDYKYQSVSLFYDKKGWSVFLPIKNYLILTKSDDNNNGYVYKLNINPTYRCMADRSANIDNTIDLSPYVNNAVQVRYCKSTDSSDLQIAVLNDDGDNNTQVKIIDLVSATVKQEFVYGGIRDIRTYGNYIAISVLQSYVYIHNIDTGELVYTVNLNYGYPHQAQPCVDNSGNLESVLVRYTDDGTGYVSRINTSDGSVIYKNNMAYDDYATIALADDKREYYYEISKKNSSLFNGYTNIGIAKYRFSDGEYIEGNDYDYDNNEHTGLVDAIVEGSYIFAIDNQYTDLFCIEDLNNIKNISYYAKGISANNRYSYNTNNILTLINGQTLEIVSYE